MNIAALIKLAPVALALIAAGWGYVERQGRQLAEERAAAQAVVIARQAEELATQKRLSAAKDATAEELRQRLEADRLRDDEIRRGLDDAIQAARASGAANCPTPPAVESALRRRLRRPGADGR